MRYGALGFLAVLAGVVGVKRRPASQSCINNGLCRGCSESTDCGLPQALSARLAKTGRNYEAHATKS